MHEIWKKWLSKARTQAWNNSKVSNLGNPFGRINTMWSSVTEPYDHGITILIYTQVKQNQANKTNKQTDSIKIFSLLDTGTRCAFFIVCDEFFSTFLSDCLDLINEDMNKWRSRKIRLWQGNSNINLKLISKYYYTVKSLWHLRRANH